MRTKNTIPAKHLPPRVPTLNTVETITDLNPNPKNPRAAWKPEQLEPFKASLLKFGDLGGIVRNLTTDQLVGGHKRVEVFKNSTNVEIVKTTQPPDAQGTVAHGFVIVDGNRFAYREVRWEPGIEAAANLAANRWTAEWEWQNVSEVLKDLGITDAALLQLTGFPEHELATLLAGEWRVAEKGTLTEADSGIHTIRLTAEQFELLQAVKPSLFRGEESELADSDAIERLCHERINR